MIIVNFMTGIAYNFWPFGTVNVHLQRIKMKQKERPVPSSLYPTTWTQSGQTETVQKLLEPLLTEDVFLVGIKIKPTNNIKVYLDADKGLGIEKCTKINRALYKVIEEMGLYPDGDFFHWKYPARVSMNCWSCSASITRISGAMYRFSCRDDKQITWQTDHRERKTISHWNIPKEKKAVLKTGNDTVRQH